MIAVSYLSSDDYKQCIKKIEESNADFIHADLCDGKYVRTKNFTNSEVIKLLQNTKKKIDIHLMCKTPEKYAIALANLNIETVTFHPLATKNINETIDTIKNLGLKVGLAINPNEKLDLIKPYLNEIDEVLVMSVTPGKGGQTFNEKVLKKLDQINEIKDNYNFITAIDGGINDETITLLQDKNIDLIISGSFVTNNQNYDESIEKLR